MGGSEGISFIKGTPSLLTIASDCRIFGGLLGGEIDGEGVLDGVVFYRWTGLGVELTSTQYDSGIGDEAEPAKLLWRARHNGDATTTTDAEIYSFNTSPSSPESGVRGLIIEGHDTLRLGTIDTGVDGRVEFMRVVAFQNGEFGHSDPGRADSWLEVEDKNGTLYKLLAIEV